MRCSAPPTQWFGASPEISAASQETLSVALAATLRRWCGVVPHQRRIFRGSRPDVGAGRYGRRGGVLDRERGVTRQTREDLALVGIGELAGERVGVGAAVGARHRE